MRDTFQGEFVRKLPRIQRSIEANTRMEAPRFEFKLLPGKIGYIVLNTLREAAVIDDFRAAFGDIEKTDGLIIDIRNNHGGNVNYSDKILGCLTNRAVDTETIESPVYRTWIGTTGLMLHRRQSITRRLQPDGSLWYRNPVALLIGPHTASAAESFAVAFDVMRRGKMIGQPTAGTNGQPVSVSLPGGGFASIASTRVRYANGKGFMFTGVKPDIYIQPRLADLRDRRDVVLTAALQYLHSSR